MDVTDLITRVLNTPEAWGGIALVSSYGWWKETKQNTRNSELFISMMDRYSDVMNRLTDHVLNKGDY